MKFLVLFMVVALSAAYIIENPTPAQRIAMFEQELKDATCVLIKTFEIAQQNQTDPSTKFQEIKEALCCDCLHTL